MNQNHLGGNLRCLYPDIGQEYEPQLTLRLVLFLIRAEECVYRSVFIPTNIIARAARPRCVFIVYRDIAQDDSLVNGRAG